MIHIETVRRVVKYKVVRIFELTLQIIQICIELGLWIWKRSRFEFADTNEATSKILLRIDSDLNRLSKSQEGKKTPCLYLKSGWTLSNSQKRLLAAGIRKKKQTRNHIDTLVKSTKENVVQKKKGPKRTLIKLGNT